MPTAIVTGSSTGIGHAIAVRLSRTHAIVVNAKKDIEGAARTCSEITGAGGEAAFVQADVTTDAGVRKVMGFTRERYGSANVLVNNAGAARGAALDHWTEAHWTDMLATNLTSCALMSKAFALSLAADAGSIINVGSVRGADRFSRISVAAYSAAKAGVISLTGALARSLAPRVTVNCISPGFVETNYMSRIDPELKDWWLRSMPIGRFVTTSEVAEAAVWLLDQRAITGTNLIIDGGWTVTSV